MFPRKLIINFRLVQVLLFVIILSNNNLIGQEVNSTVPSNDIIRSAYIDVWQPFMESYRDLDIEKFKSLQAIDLTKVSIDRNTIQTKSVYFAEIAGFFDQFKKLKRQLDIKFSILSTATGNDKIYQTGYYCIGARPSNSGSFQPLGYGYFTVVLINENDHWKISMDADKQVAIDEEEFRKSDVIYQLE